MNYCLSLVLVSIIGMLSYVTKKSPFVAMNIDGCNKSLVIMVIVQFTFTVIIRV